MDCVLKKNTMRIIVSKKKIIKCALLGGVWGFISSCAIFPRQYSVSHANFLREHIPPNTLVGDHFPEFWNAILNLISQILFFPAALFQTLGFVGVVLAISLGVIIGAIVGLFLKK